MPYDINTNFLDSTSTLVKDIGFVSPVGFRLSIDSLTFKNAQFFIQLAALPNVSVPSAPYNTPKRNIGVHGDKVVYEPFTCTFLIDEEMHNYTEIHNWLLAQVIENDTVKKTRDMTLSILSSHNNIIKQIQFIDAYPTDLSSLPFDTTQTDIEYLTAAVTFDFSYYKII